jgi:hypothetical protein
MLLLHRLLGLRPVDAFPSAREVLTHLIVWSCVFELLGPRVFSHAIGDIWDIAAYGTGALASFAIWKARAGQKPSKRRLA